MGLIGPRVNGLPGRVLLALVAVALWLSLGCAGTALAWGGSSSGDHKSWSNEGHPGAQQPSHHGPSASGGQQPPGNGSSPEQSGRECKSPPAETPGGGEQPGTQPSGPPQGGYPSGPPPGGHKPTPPEQGKPVAPPEHGQPVTPPEHGQPVAPPEHGQPVAPPEQQKPVAPPEQQKPVAPPKQLKPVAAPPQSPASPIQEQHGPNQLVKGESEQGGQAPSGGSKTIPVSGETQAGAVAGAGSQTGTAQTLPFTGVNAVLLLVLGLMALGLGAGLRKVLRAER
jgi:hypothetical protein